MSVRRPLEPIGVSSVLVLGIETSCDDTAVALVVNGCEVLADAVSSQMQHKEYGGVVPEIAARLHVENLPTVLDAALQSADLGLEAIDGVGVTRGPGLIGALLSGWCFGRGLAYALGVPHVAVHHLAAHIHGALMPAMERDEEIPYPLLALVVSGGHTALYRMAAPGRYRTLGETRDDAAGEAFDKVAWLLGLGYPGGPLIDHLSESGDPEAFMLPRAKLGDTLEFSFSGLKTAVRRLVLNERLQGQGPSPRVTDIAASFQAAAVDMLIETSRRALRRHLVQGLVLCGGVAANRSLRARMEALALEEGIQLHTSPPDLSTDNAAMIAGIAHAQLLAGHSDPLELGARAMWPLAGRGWALTDE